MKIFELEKLGEAIGKGFVKELFGNCQGYLTYRSVLVEELIEKFGNAIGKAIAENGKFSMN